MNACIELGVDANVKLDRGMLRIDYFWNEDIEDVDNFGIGYTGLDLAKNRKHEKMMSLLESHKQMYLSMTFLKACFDRNIGKVKECIELGVDVTVKLDENMIRKEDFWDEDMNKRKGNSGLDLAHHGHLLQVNPIGVGLV